MGCVRRAQAKILYFQSRAVMVSLRLLSLCVFHATAKTASALTQLESRAVDTSIAYVPSSGYDYEHRGFSGSVGVTMFVQMQHILF